VKIKIGCRPSRAHHACCPAFLSETSRIHPACLCARRRLHPRRRLPDHKQAFAIRLFRRSAKLKAFCGSFQCRRDADDTHVFLTRDCNRDAISSLRRQPSARLPCRRRSAPIIPPVRAFSRCDPMSSAGNNPIGDTSRRCRVNAQPQWSTLSCAGASISIHKQSRLLNLSRACGEPSPHTKPFLLRTAVNIWAVANSSPWIAAVMGRKRSSEKAA
jgi:hypothetical protein